MSNRILKIISIVLLNAFLLLNIAGAQAGELLKIEQADCLSPALQLNSQIFAEFFSTKGLKLVVDETIAYAMIKPDGYPMQKEILSLIENAGFEILIKQEKTFSSDEMKEFYKIHKEMPFFNGLVEYGSSGPVVQLVLRRKGKRPAFTVLREYVGKSDGSTRKSWRNKLKVKKVKMSDGTKVTMNKIHTSDSLPNVAIEISSMNNIKAVLAEQVKKPDNVQIETASKINSALTGLKLLLNDKIFNHNELEADVLMICGNDDISVLEEAVSLYASGKINKILITGGYGRLTLSVIKTALSAGMEIKISKTRILKSKAELYELEALDHQNRLDEVVKYSEAFLIRQILKHIAQKTNIRLAKEDIILEQCSKNTRENFTNSVRILSNLRNSMKLSTLTFAYMIVPHQQFRAKATYNSLKEKWENINVKGISYTTDWFVNGTPVQELVNKIASEMWRLVLYTAKGDLVPRYSGRDGLNAIDAYYWDYLFDLINAYPEKGALRQILFKLAGQVDVGGEKIYLSKNKLLHDLKLRSGEKVNPRIERFIDWIYDEGKISNELELKNPKTRQWFESRRDIFPIIGLMSLAHMVIAMPIIGSIWNYFNGRFPEGYMAGTIFIGGAITIIGFCAPMFWHAFKSLQSKLKKSRAAEVVKSSPYAAVLSSSFGFGDDMPELMARGSLISMPVIIALGVLAGLLIFNTLNKNGKSNKFIQPLRLWWYKQRLNLHQDSKIKAMVEFSARKNKDIVGLIGAVEAIDKYKKDSYNFKRDTGFFYSEIDELVAGMRKPLGLVDRLKSAKSLWNKDSRVNSEIMLTRNKKIELLLDSLVNYYINDLFVEQVEKTNSRIGLLKALSSKYYEKYGSFGAMSDECKYFEEKLEKLKKIDRKYRVVSNWFSRLYHKYYLVAQLKSKLGVKTPGIFANWIYFFMERHNQGGLFNNFLFINRFYNIHRSVRRYKDNWFEREIVDLVQEGLSPGEIVDEHLKLNLKSSLAERRSESKKMLEKFVKAGMLTKTNLISIYMHVLETGTYDAARNVVLGLNNYLHDMDKNNRIKVVKHLELNFRKHNKKLKESRVIFKSAPDKRLLEAAEKENILIQALLAHLAMRIMADIEKQDDLFAAVDAAEALELTFDELNNKILLKIEKNMQKIIKELEAEIDKIDGMLTPETIKERVLNGLKNNKAENDPLYSEKQLLGRLKKAKKKADKLLVLLKKKLIKKMERNENNGNGNSSAGNGLKHFNIFASKLFKRLPFANNSSMEIKLIEQAI